MNELLTSAVRSGRPSEAEWAFVDKAVLTVQVLPPAGPPTSQTGKVETLSVPYDRRSGDSASRTLLRAFLAQVK